MCFGPSNGCMIHLMQCSTWAAISSLRDLDRWLVYSACSGCLARWTLDYTCCSAVFDFGKGREAAVECHISKIPDVESLWTMLRWTMLSVESVERIHAFVITHLDFASSTIGQLSQLSQSWNQSSQQSWITSSYPQPVRRYYRYQICYHVDFIVLSTVSSSILPLHCYHVDFISSWYHFDFIVS